jgi:hypothetical protein
MLVLAVSSFGSCTVFLAGDILVVFTKLDSSGFWVGECHEAARTRAESKDGYFQVKWYERAAASPFSGPYRLALQKKKGKNKGKPLKVDDVHIATLLLNLRQCLEDEVTLKESDVAWLAKLQLGGVVAE